MKQQVAWLLGPGLAVLTFVALSFAPQGLASGPCPSLSQKDVPFPHPRDIVRVVQGNDYVVPDGKLLTLREFVASGPMTFGAVLKVDGQGVFLVRVDFGEIQELELGIVAKAGQVVTLESDTITDPAIAIGFLVDD